MFMLRHVKCASFKDEYLGFKDLAKEDVEDEGAGEDSDSVETDLNVKLEFL